MKSVFFIIMVLLCVSCKKQEENVFRAFINIKVLEDDNFQIFYIDNLELGYSEKKRKTIQVKGTEEFQTIVFELPHGVFPKMFRIDLGENKKESPIEIESVTLKHNDKTIEINDLIFDRFFKPNIYLDKTDKTFLRHSINGRYDPFLLSTPLLNKKIELEF